METNTANENRTVYALTYTAQDMTAYCAGIFDIFETLPRAKKAVRDTINYLRDNGYGLVIDDPGKEHYILYHRNLQREYHLFIEKRQLH